MNVLDSIEDFLRPLIDAHPAAYSLLRRLILGAAAAALIGAIASIVYDVMGPWPYDVWKENQQQLQHETNPQHP